MKNETVWYETSVDIQDDKLVFTPVEDGVSFGLPNNQISEHGLEPEKLQLVTVDTDFPSAALINTDLPRRDDDAWYESSFLVLMDDGIVRVGYLEESDEDIFVFFDENYDDDYDDDDHFYDESEEDYDDENNYDEDDDDDYVDDENEGIEIRRDQIIGEVLFRIDGYYFD